MITALIIAALAYAGARVIGQARPAGPGLPRSTDDRLGRLADPRPEMDRLGRLADPRPETEFGEPARSRASQPNRRDVSPRVHSMKEGETIVGFLEGTGDGLSLVDRSDISIQAITRRVDTWIIRLPDGVRLLILSTTQLDELLRPFIGMFISIHRDKPDCEPLLHRTTEGSILTKYTVRSLQILRILPVRSADE